MAGVEAAPQRCDLGLGEAVEHLRLQGGYRVPVAVEELLACWGQHDGQATAVGPVAVPLDEASSFQGGDHVGHGLGGDEGVAGQLR